MLITPIKPAQEDAWGSTISSQSSNDTSAPSEVDHSDDSTSSSDSSSPISSPKTPPSSEYSLSMSSSDHSSSDSISRDEELPALITRVMTKGTHIARLSVCDFIRDFVYLYFIFSVVIKVIFSPSF